jgi:hypothetical protein
MPNRILRNWTDSMRFENISADAERLFTRLIMQADDYGRFHAEPRLIKAGCFPLQDQIRPNDLTRWLEELSHRQLILRYEVSGRAFLAIINFGQRLKQSRAKFPPPAGKPDDFLPVSADFREVPGSSGKFRPESETETDGENEIEKNAGACASGQGEGNPPKADQTPTLAEVLEAAKLASIPADHATQFFNACEARTFAPSGGWTTRDGQPMNMDRWRNAMAAYSASMTRGMVGKPAASGGRRAAPSKWDNEF